MNWEELVVTIKSGRLDQLNRLPCIQQIYNSRPRRIPADGLYPNNYPYHVGERIYNYVLFGDNIKFSFPKHIKIISYVNPPHRRSIPEKHHINIFLTSDYVPNGYINDIPPDIEFVKDIIWYGHKQYPPFHPTIYLYYKYLLFGGDRYFNDFLMLVDPWFRNLK